MLSLKERLAAARGRARSARCAGADRLFSLRVDALERADQALDRLDELPVVGRAASAVAAVVERRLEALAAVPVEGWAELNAKSAIQAVRKLDRSGLRAARLHEARHKGRKTVLAAIDDALAA